LPRPHDDWQGDEIPAPSTTKCAEVSKRIYMREHSMNKRALVGLVSSVALAAPLTYLTAPASAEQVPNGPWVCGEQPIQLNGLLSNEELQAELERLAAQRPDALDLEVEGHSVEGRPIYSATVGDGDRTLMLMTQLHGDEPLGTEAAVQLLKDITAPSSAAAALRENVTVVVVPRVNPDGWERYQDRDFADGIDPRRNSNNIDLNRTFGPSDIDPALAPETVAVKNVVEVHQPDLIVDYHHQVSYATDAGDLVTMSVLWATHPDVAPAVADDGRRAAVVVADSLERSGHANVTLYPRSNTETVARNGLGLDGYPTLLVEQRGQQEVGQKSSGALVREALTSMKGLAGSFADGTFDAVDPEAAEAIPERGTRVHSTC
jgi:hypothetical protein